MKLQVKVTFVVLFLGILWLIGLFASKDAFAVNQTTFQITFANGGDAQSWVDYNIFEDKTSPFGQYNSGDLVLYYTGNSPDLGFGEWLSVPAYSSVTVNRGPKTDYLPSSPVYVAYLPWKYENSDPRDVGCEDPVASVTAKSITVISANDIHAVVGTSVSYSCWVPQPPPPPPPPSGIPTPVNFKLGPLPSCKNYGEAYQVDASFATSGDATYGEMEVNPFDPPADAGYYAPSGFYYPSGTTFPFAISSLFPGGTYTWWAQAGNTSGASGWVQGPSWNVPVCNTAPSGWLDAADCSSFRGWAYDADAPNTAISVHFYRDGPAGSGVWVDSATANIYRSDVGWHGFVLATPASLKDGQNHSIYAYGIDSQGGSNPLLSGSPKTFNCPLFDLSASFVGGSWNKQSFKAGETATAVVMVTNISPPANITGPATTLGLWKGQSGEVPIANCPSSPQPTPPIAYTKDKNNKDIGVLPPGNIQEVNISFNVGSNAGQFTANAYVIPSCTTTLGADSNWANNSTSGSGNISFTYTVTVDAWFETTGGDVGSKGGISVAQNPPGGRFQSGYLLVGNLLASNVTSQKWRITGYDKPLTAGAPYAYLAERFRQAAAAGSKICQVSAGWAAGYNYCDEPEAAFNSGNGPNGHSVFFIDGNFTIKNNLTLDSRYSAIFIVKGNITVETDVTRIDGIYIAGGTFTTTDSAAGISGSQLVINGAVYGTNVNLSRKLSSTATCAGGVTPCTNAAQPAEKIVYDPKYLIALNDLLGSPGVSWKEVAP